MMNYQTIIEEIKNDPRNAQFTKQNINPVIQFSKDAKILIIGQSPGEKAQASGILFNDKSGDNLIKWLGINRETFYSDKIAIVPMDFYYQGKGPSGDIAPRMFISREYHSQILALMPNVQLTLLVGNYAINYYLKDDKQRDLTETVRHFEAYLPKYFPLVHPSPLNFRWQGHNPWFVSDVLPQLKIYVKKALEDN